MSGHFIFCCFIFALGVRSGSAQSVGDAACPCIDVFAKPVLVRGVAVNASDPCPWKSDDGTCFPASYGSSQCLPHDIVQASCTARTPADEMPWCDTPWCYVDPDQCERLPSTSNFFKNVLRDGKPLSYSYSTCGYLDYYNRGDRELRAFGRRLRVSWAPIDSSTGFTKLAAPTGEEGVRDSTGVDTGQTGSIVHFMADLFKDYGLEWEYVPLSAESMQYSDSDVTNCIHEVATNRTDMCWFDSWLLDFRLELTTMVELFEDSFKVMVRVDGTEEVSFVDMIKVPFMPFTWQLWLIIVGQYVLSSLVIWGVEGAYNDEDFPSPSLKFALIHSVFNGCTAAFGGGMLLHPKTAEGKIVSVGLALSTLVFVSVYRAQVTTALIETKTGQGRTGKLASFEQGLEAGALFCVYAFTEPFIQARWPGINTVAVGAGGKVFELFDALHEGKCDASIIIENWWVAAQAGKYSGPDSPIFESVYAQHLAELPAGFESFHCDDKIFPLASEEPIWGIPNGIPVREELARMLRWAIGKAQNDPARNYRGYEERFRQRFVTAAAECDDAPHASAGENSLSATVEDGVGATMVSVFFTAAALLVYAGKRLLRPKREERSAPEEEERTIARVSSLLSRTGGSEMLASEPSFQENSVVRENSERARTSVALPPAKGASVSTKKGLKMTGHIHTLLTTEGLKREQAVEAQDRKLEQMQATLDAIASSLNLNLDVRTPLAGSSSEVKPGPQPEFGPQSDVPVPVTPSPGGAMGPELTVPMMRRPRSAASSQYPDGHFRT